MSYFEIIKQIKEKCDCKSGCEKCDKKILLLTKFKNANIPIKYVKLKLDNIEDIVLKEMVSSYINNIKKAHEDGIGLYIYGPNGTGKTAIEVIIMKEVIKLGYTAKYYQFSYVIDKFYNREDNNINDFITCDFLILDDIDKAYIANNSTYPLSKLDYILRYRCQRNMVTIISSNLSINQYLGKIKNQDNEIFITSLLSLFNEAFIPIKVDGEDYRKKIRERNKLLFLKNDNI